MAANPTQSLEDRPTSYVEFGLGDIPQAGRMEDIYVVKDWLLRQIRNRWQRVNLPTVNIRRKKQCTINI